VIYGRWSFNLPVQDKLFEQFKEDGAKKRVLLKARGDCLVEQVELASDHADTNHHMDVFLEK
jgi:hypothetical protein